MQVQAQLISSTDPSSSSGGRLETCCSSRFQEGDVPAFDNNRETFLNIVKAVAASASAASAALRGAREGAMGNCAQKLHGKGAQTADK